MNIFKAITTTKPFAVSTGLEKEQMESLCKHLAVDKVILLNQTHSDTCIDIDFEKFDFDNLERLTLLGPADAMLLSNFHQEPNCKVAFGIKTADCLPVVISSQHRLALIHAGWRGIANGLLEKMVAEISKDVGEKSAYIGPAAKGCCYEVANDVLIPLGISKPGQEKAFIDLQVLATAILDKYKVNDNLECLAHCTLCNQNYHSFRRDNSIERNLTYVVF